MQIMNFAYFLRRFDSGCNVNPEREGVIFMNERLTYAQLNSRMKSLTGALQEIGFKKGERLGILLKNCTEWFDLFFAVANLGGVIVPINFMYKPAEAEFILNDSGASFLVVGDDLVETITPIRTKVRKLKEIICVEEFGGKRPRDFLSYSDLPFKEVDITDRMSLADPFYIQYTSGTTGTPKGALHTQGTLLWNVLCQMIDFDMRQDSCTLTIPSLCWAAGFHDFTLASLWLGGKVVLMPSGHIDIKTVLEIIQRERITNLVLVPTLLKLLAEFPDVREYDLSSLDFVLTGGEAAPVTVLERLIEIIPDVKIIQGFGLSEGPTIATFLPRNDILRKVGSAGLPIINCELSIVDENLKRLPPGMEGEIVLRSPATMVGYWNRPEETEEAFLGGWFHTGDSGKYDEEGYIYITGRKKDMIISGGLNVYPAEIENVILRDSRVEEVAVIGIPDEKWGEVGKAIIKLKSGQSMKEEEIFDLCKRDLANFKVPKHVKFIEEPLPRTLSGKVKKFELREKEKLTQVTR